MKISILSRSEMLNLLHDHDNDEEAVLSKYNVISIFDDDGPVFQARHENLLELDFHDITPDYSYERCRLFNKEQANNTVAFIAKIPPCKNLIVHCRAGISRSGAVGTFAAIARGESVASLHQRHPRVHPNQWVLSLLQEVRREIHREAAKRIVIVPLDVARPDSNRKPTAEFIPFHYQRARKPCNISEVDLERGRMVAWTFGATGILVQEYPLDAFEALFVEHLEVLKRMGTS